LFEGSKNPSFSVVRVKGQRQICPLLETTNYIVMNNYIKTVIVSRGIFLIKNSDIPLSKVTKM